MAFKQRVEEHPVVFFLSGVVGSFVAGFALHAQLLSISQQELQAQSKIVEAKTADYEKLQKELAECRARVLPIAPTPTPSPTPSPTPRPSPAPTRPRNRIRTPREVAESSTTPPTRSPRSLTTPTPSPSAQFSPISASTPTQLPKPLAGSEAPTRSSTPTPTPFPSFLSPHALKKIRIRLAYVDLRSVEALAFRKLLEADGAVVEMLVLQKKKEPTPRFELDRFEISYMNPDLLEAAHSAAAMITHAMADVVVEYKDGMDKSIDLYIKLP